VQDHRPKEWNKFLFDRLIPTAWAKLLQNVCQGYSNQDHSHLWPTNSSNTRQLWSSLCHAVVDQISENHLPVWYTDAGYVALEHGLLAQKNTHLKERAAFREARLPIIFVENYVLDEVRRTPGIRLLQPRTLHQFLQRFKKEGKLSGPSKVVLLEYLLRDCSTTELRTFKIFPFQDGKFRSLDQEPVFLHRCNLEKTLFAQQQNSTIDTDKLSASASQTLHGHAKKANQLVRYRSPDDLRDYYLKHIANGTADTIELDENARSTLSQVWSWILLHSKNNSPISGSALASLWLVPLRGSTIRRLVPVDTSNSITWFHPGEVNDISFKIIASIPEMAPKILAVDEFSDDISQGLLRFAKKEESMCIKDGNNFGNFLDFLAQGRTLIQTATDDVKNSAVRALKHLYWSQSPICTGQDCRVLKSLCLFKAVKWPADAIETSVTRYWTDMTSDVADVAFVGLKSLVPVPSSPKHVFIDMTDEDVRRILERLDLLKCLSDLQLLEDIVVPAIYHGSYNHMNPNLRLEVVDLLFRNYFSISATTRHRLPSLEIVPLKKRTDTSSLSFGRPLDVLDPQKPALKNLYFEDETFLPEEQFYDRFSAALTDSGMVKSLTERVVIDRVQSFGGRELEFATVASRAQDLLRLRFPTKSAQLNELTRIVRETNWLPARSSNKSNSLVSSSRCRDIRDDPFVSYVWHVLPFQIDDSWISILGWQNPIALDVLILQLMASINVSDLTSVERTLSYIWLHYSTVELANRLLKLDFVRSSKGKLVNANKACRSCAEMLTPYLCTVEPRFWDAHIDIMRLTNIPETPTLEQLKDVQSALGSNDCLNERDLDVAVEVARIWSVQFPGSVEGLKLPDSHGMLRDVSDLAFNDTPWLSQGKCAMVHSNISRTIADKLMIEPLSELVRKGDLGIADPGDDEFDQREEVADGIRDTLERYSRESTFCEYLANADDCTAASEVNFLIDGSCHVTEHLITKDLEELQGPSLLVHNDGGE
jgi:sacsin